MILRVSHQEPVSLQSLEELVDRYGLWPVIRVALRAAKRRRPKPRPPDTVLPAYLRRDIGLADLPPSQNTWPQRF
jgi:hypothetical protein